MLFRQLETFDKRTLWPMLDPLTIDIGGQKWGMMRG